MFTYEIFIDIIDNSKFYILWAIARNLSVYNKFWYKIENDPSAKQQILKLYFFICFYSIGFKT